MGNLLCHKNDLIFLHRYEDFLKRTDPHLYPTHRMNVRSGIPTQINSIVYFFLKKILSQEFNWTDVTCILEDLYNRAAAKILDQKRK